MRIKKIKGKNYNLNMIKNNHFKSIVISIQFKNKILKENITLNSLLSDVLIYSSKKYPNKIAITNKTRDLYGTYISSDISRVGDAMIIDIYASILNEKYTEEKMLEKNIEFLKEIIFNPNIKNKKFDSLTFNIIKKRLKSTLEDIKDNQTRYTQLKMLEHMDEIVKSYSFNIDGYLDDLAKIDEKMLYDYYQKLMKNSNIDIYVIGDIKFKEMENIIKSKLKFNNLNNQKLEFFIPVNKVLEKEIKETSTFNQSKIAIGCKIKDGNNDKEILYPLFLYNNILGGNTDSKLFTNIRERKSYAYYINSNLYISDNLIIINAGISKNNYRDVLKMIKHEMNEMKLGNFTEKDITSAKNNFTNAITTIEDSIFAILNMYSSVDMLGVDDIDTRLKMINKLTKEDIMQVADKIYIDTVYLLEEGNNNENN